MLLFHVLVRLYLWKWKGRCPGASFVALFYGFCILHRVLEYEQVLGEVRAANLLCLSTAMYSVHLHSSDIEIVLTACN